MKKDNLSKDLRYLETHFPCGPDGESGSMSIRMYYLCHKGIGMDVLRKLVPRGKIDDDLRALIKKELSVYHQKIIPAWNALRRKKRFLRCILWVIISLALLLVCNPFVIASLLVAWAVGSPVALPLFLLNDFVERLVNEIVALQLPSGTCV